MGWRLPTDFEPPTRVYHGPRIRENTAWRATFAASFAPGPPRFEHRRLLQQTMLRTLKTSNAVEQSESLGELSFESLAKSKGSNSLSFE